MTVAVASGTARIGGADVAVTIGNVTITANSSGSPRLDLICVNSSGTKTAQAGTASAIPKYPAIPANSAVLAAVLVPTGAGSITVDNITDKRCMVSSGVPASHNHAASEITSGTIATARLGSGTANATTVLRGDQTWSTVPVEWTVAMSDETTNLAGTGQKLAIRAPFAATLVGVRSSLSTASSSGLVTVDINENGTTILSTKLSIDANEKTSTSAATPAVISDTAIADDAEITFDLDAVGTGARGLKVTMYVVHA